MWHMSAICYNADMSKLLEKIHHRNAFYASSYRLLLSLNVCLSCILLALVIWSGYLYRLKPQAIYFPATPEGKLIQDPPVNQPYWSDEEVLTWAEKVAILVYDFDYVNYRQALQNLRTYFTQTGHAEYLKALTFSTNIEAIKANKQIVSAEVNGTPLIKSKGVNSGFFYWQAMIPLLITYENSSGKIFQQRVHATMVIVRGSTLEFPQGLSVHQMILEEVEA
jgi:intracellular multiplication protein IcmL